MQPVVHPFILSGGAGSRLWPLSTRARPKQYHALTTQVSMLADTLQRVAEIPGCQLASPAIICAADHAGLSRAILQAEGVRRATIVCEPQGRNTAPAAAMACLLAVEADPEALVLLLPSDHHIGAVAAFRAALAEGARHARAGRLVAFGVHPTRPETGYGYIARGPEEQGSGAFAIARFVEKPPLAQAEAMLAQGGHDWNAGIFLFHAATFLSELARLRPAMLAGVKAALENGTRTPDGAVTPQPALWAQVEADSIDYAVMQQTTHGLVVPVDMDWSDMGSFQTLWELAAHDPSGNALSGDALVCDGARGNLVRADGGRLIALVGCEDMVVVDTGSAVLVMPRSKAQSVRLVVEALKSAGRSADY
jgi:mannose-1-phosphate guanylyltransferase/mannose-6-phosphate isomerase